MGIIFSCCKTKEKEDAVTKTENDPLKLISSIEETTPNTGAEASNSLYSNYNYI